MQSMCIDAVRAGYISAVRDCRGDWTVVVPVKRGIRCTIQLCFVKLLRSIGPRVVAREVTPNGCGYRTTVEINEVSKARRSEQVELTVRAGCMTIPQRCYR